MDKLKIIRDFFIRIESDPVIDPVHISLFMALWQLADLKESPYISIERETTMRLSKIASPKTYFRKMRELNDRGFIAYYPSHKSNVPTKVTIKSKLKT